MVTDLLHLLPVSIGLGLIISLLFSEAFGLAAGGMVVPGYIALYLNQPLTVILTLVAAFATYTVVHLLSTFIILYGRRRTVLMILVGYLIGAVLRYIPIENVSEMEYTIIGYIIPGLIAIWMDRQGLAETISSLLTASVVVRLIIILLFGMELQA